MKMDLKIDVLDITAPFLHVKENVGTNDKMMICTIPFNHILITLE
jgi:hypothetical protein